MKGLSLGLSMTGSAGGVSLGAEQVGDPGFDDGAYWGTTAGAAISGSKAVFNQPYATTNVTVFRNTTVTQGPTYEVSFTVSNYNSGTIRAYISGAAMASPTYTPAGGANGTFTAQITPTNTGQFGLNTADDFIGSIDNFSIKEVL